MRKNEFPYSDPTVLQLGTGVLRAWVESGRDAAERYLWDVTSATVRDPAMGWLGAGVIYLLVAGGLKFLGTNRIKKRYGTCILRYSRFVKKKGDPQRKMEEMTLEMIMVDLARYGGKFWGMRIPEVSIKLADVMGVEVLRLMNVDPPVQKEKVEIKEEPKEEETEEDDETKESTDAGPVEPENPGGKTTAK